MGEGSPWGQSGACILLPGEPGRAAATLFPHLPSCPGLLAALDHWGSLRPMGTSGSPLAQKGSGPHANLLPGCTSSRSLWRPCSGAALAPPALPPSACSGLPASPSSDQALKARAQRWQVNVSLTGLRGGIMPWAGLAQPQFPHWPGCFRARWGYSTRSCGAGGGCR